MRIVSSAVCLAGSLLLAGTAAAQDPEPADAPATPQHIETQLGFDLLTGRIQDVAAEREGTGTRAWGGQATGSVTAYRILTFNGELGIVDMRDGRQFSQETTEGEMSSSVSAFLGTFSAGLRTPPLALGEVSPLRVSAGVNAGNTWLKTRRGITDCVDCHNEDVDLQAGSFVEPALYVTRGRGGLNARYRMYGSGSHWENALMIGYTWAIRPGAKKAEAEEPAGVEQ